MSVLVACAAAVATALLVGRLPCPTAPHVPSDGAAPPPPTSAGRLLRPLLAAAAGCGCWVVVGGGLGVVAAPFAAALALLVLHRSVPTAVRREQEEAARELPHLVDLLAATLRSGAAPLDGLATVAAAFPGPAARRVAPMLAAVRFGGTFGWSDEPPDDGVLAPLVRALARAERSGSSVVDVVEQLADELERESGAAAEDRARRVGVSAAVPLGVCLLPAFLLIGIVPTVAGLLSEVTR